MQILANKNGTRLTLNGKERKRLGEAVSLLLAIEKHGDGPLSEFAGSAATHLEKTIQFLHEAETETATT